MAQDREDGDRVKVLKNMLQALQDAKLAPEEQEKLRRAITEIEERAAKRNEAHRGPRG